MDSAFPTTQTKSPESSAPERRNTVTITDNRTGKSYEIPITHDTIRAMDLRQIKVNPTDFGMISYDPAYNNTASCISRVTYIDGDAGILRYRGYPIEELAEKSTYLETAYLLLYGELPTATQLKDWQHSIVHHTFIHESIKKFLDGFRLFITMPKIFLIQNRGRSRRTGSSERCRRLRHFLTGTRWGCRSCIRIMI
jgi:citrate synthase